MCELGLTLRLAVRFAFFVAVAAFLSESLVEHRRGDLARVPVVEGVGFGTSAGGFVRGLVGDFGNARASASLVVHNRVEDFHSFEDLRASRVRGVLGKFSAYKGL